MLERSKVGGRREPQWLPPPLSDLLPQPGWAAGLLEEWMFPAGLAGRAPEQRGQVSLSQGKQETAVSQSTNSSRLEKDQGEGEMGRVTGRSGGSMEAGCPQELCRGLVISERISAAGCAPAAPFPHLAPAPVVLSTWGGQGSARGCRDMGPAWEACDLPGSPGARRALPAFCSSFAFFSTFGCFPPSASIPLCVQHSPTFHPQLPS